ncbi:MAG: ferrous iron transport protein B, partial [Planctomycetota bacterium]|nr:ferrous iron transport protein B [Planctomycetota bacterium]
ALILPYLVPFLFALALLEDIGYLPRVAFLMDAFMHRIGLHGKAVIPLVLGYGCTVPAIMSIRILEQQRDRFIAGVLVNFIPCAARATVIFALIGFTLGPWHAFGVYFLNLLVVALAGRILSRLHSDMSLGMILELPTYKFPSLRSIAAKIWLRLRDFIVVAWPILIVSSAGLSILQYYGWAKTVDALLAPFVSGVLGLPPAVGMLLILGILRKEMTVLMLGQALGTSEWIDVLSPAQIAVFTIFVVFYTPCLATLAMMRAALGARLMLLSVAVSTGLAVILALIARAVFALGTMVGMMLR